MTEGLIGRPVIGGAVFAGCMLVLLLGRLLPLSPGHLGAPGPDIALCLTIAWVLRRPHQVPALLIALPFLAEDLLLMRPPGLWAVIVLLASEALRARQPHWRDYPFVVEWLRVAILIGLMTLAYRLAQIVFFLPVPSAGQVALRLIATIAAYPVVVFAGRWLLGLRTVSAAEADMMRYRR